jgi:hypothetical protein
LHRTNRRDLICRHASSVGSALRFGSERQLGPASAAVRIRRRIDSDEAARRARGTSGLARGVSPTSGRSDRGRGACVQRQPRVLSQSQDRCHARGCLRLLGYRPAGVGSADHLPASRRRAQPVRHHPIQQVRVFAPGGQHRLLPPARPTDEGKHYNLLPPSNQSGRLRRPRTSPSPIVSPTDCCFFAIIDAHFAGRSYVTVNERPAMDAGTTGMGEWHGGHHS